MRAALVDAAEQLIREEGYPAVTARNLADKVNLSRQIVHYYFRSMDDVFIAVIRKNSLTYQVRMEEIERSEEPLRALHMLNREPARAILAMELYALANHRPAVRAEVVRAAAQTREWQARVLSEHLKKRGMTPQMDPVVATILLTSLAQILALEDAIDFDVGHDATLKFVDTCLRAFADNSENPFPAALAPKAVSPKRSRVVTTNRPKRSGYSSVRARR
jgi:AcrR family transcriptional regulator